jgi:hypothetical protein
VADYAHYDAYVNGIKARGTGAIRDYLDKYVYGVKTHEAYLALFEQAVLKQNERDAKELLG